MYFFQHAICVVLGVIFNIPMTLLRDILTKDAFWINDNLFPLTGVEHSLATNELHKEHQ